MYPSLVRRGFLLIGGGILLLGLVIGYAAFSLVETKRKVLAAAETQARALLRTVSAGVERSIAASAALERLLSEHLLATGRDLAAELAASPGREEMILRAAVIRHRLKGGLLLDPDLDVLVNAAPVAASPAALPALTPSPRLSPLVTGDLVRRARSAGLGEGGAVVVGFGENPFGTQAEFLVGLPLESGGYVLLRQDAEALRGLRERAGVQRLLEGSVSPGGVTYLLLEDRAGRVVAASDPARVGESLPPPEGGPDWRGTGAERVLEVSVPATWEGSEGGRLRVGLAAGPVEDVRRRGEESVLLFTGITVLVGAAGAAALLFLDRRRRREEEALEAELRAREQAVVLGRLSGAVAHEIRSPLNAIAMGAQRLMRQAAPEGETGKILGSIRREVDRLNRTVEEFLDLGRSRPLDLALVDAGALVEEVLEAEHPSAAREPPPAPMQVLADREELRKALANLVRNARAAAGEGAVVVAWRTDGARARFEVRDAGPGVSREDREKVFLHFFSRRSGGTGLGLAVARSVATRHGGDITVDDAPEGGAMFTLFLPAQGAR